MDINQACEAFRILLQEQTARIENMNCEKTDFSTKKTVTIGVIDGDGIGPIITKQAASEPHFSQGLFFLFLISAASAMRSPSSMRVA